MFEEFFGQITPALILVMIPGIVEFFKKLGVGGNWPLVLSMVLGIILGLVLQLQVMFPTIAPWVNLVIYSIAFGMTASGYYDMAKRFTIGKDG